MQPNPASHSYPATIERCRPSQLGIPLGIALLSAGFAGIALTPGFAQLAAQAPTARGPSAPQPNLASPDALKQREQELEAARLEQKSAAEIQARLKADVEAIGQDRSKLSARL